MPKVFCAAIECEHNKNNQCKAKTVNLSDGHIHTVHQGFKQIWECKSYSMSKEAKRMNEFIKSCFGGKEG